MKKINVPSGLRLKCLIVALLTLLTQFSACRDDLNSSEDLVLPTDESYSDDYINHNSVAPQDIPSFENAGFVVYDEFVGKKEQSREFVSESDGVYEYNINVDGQIYEVLYNDGKLSYANTVLSDGTIVYWNYGKNGEKQRQVSFNGKVEKDIEFNGDSGSEMISEYCEIRYWNNPQEDNSKMSSQKWWNADGSFKRMTIYNKNGEPIIKVYKDENGKIITSPVKKENNTGKHSKGYTRPSNKRTRSH